MPFVKIGKNKYRGPSGKVFTEGQVKLYYATNGKFHKKLKVDNKMKWLGETDEKGNIKINIKRHKGDKKELASTIKHELLHRNYPKMLEKNVYKRSRKTKIKDSEANKLLKKIYGKSKTKK